MIRIMTPDDYDAVHACWMACTCMGLNTIDDSREGIIRYLERNPNTCFVDEQEGTITGAILAGHDGRRGYIYHTAVTPRIPAPRHRHRTRQRRTACARERRHHQSRTLVAFSRNDAGNAFWERLGFTARGDLTYRNKALCSITRIDT